jgi:glucan endo-1,3-beta-D-glucosidase
LGLNIFPDATAVRAPLGQVEGRDMARFLDDVLAQVRVASAGRELWVTAVGWPVLGRREDGEVLWTAQRARRFWQEVGCARLFSRVNTWWYTFHDASPWAPQWSFGVIGLGASRRLGGPMFDFTCPRDVP